MNFNNWQKSPERPTMYYVRMKQGKFDAAYTLIYPEYYRVGLTIDYGYVNAYLYAASIDDAIEEVKKVRAILYDYDY